MVKNKTSQKELKRKIAQLICVEVRCPDLDKSETKTARLKKSVKNNQWGSIIIFEAEADKAKKLIKEFQELSEIRLFVCSDLERGTGQHFKGATVFPSNMAIGAANDPQLAYQAGKITAMEAKALGVNVIFAPTADVNNNPDNPIINVRSYGEDPKQVAVLVSEFIRGCNEEGVITTAKHFPGHGDTAVDSHVDLPVITKSLAQLEKMELVPFREAIKKGAPGIMSAHIAVSAIDPTLTPGTMSKPVITDLLRKKLKFKGLVFTDALIMAGAKDEGNNQPDVVRALEAGCDILLMPPQPVKALNQILKAVNEGILSEEVINTAFNRVMEYKNNFIKSEPTIFDQKSGKKIAGLIAREAVTRIKGDYKLPVNPKNKKIIHFVIDQDNNPEIWQKYADHIKKVGIPTVSVNDHTTLKQLPAIAKDLQQADLILLSFFSQIKAWKKHIYPRKEIFVWLEKILKNRNIVAIAFSNPYLLRKLPFLQNYFCAFSDSPESQEAVTDMLFGDFKPVGKSPVTIE